MQNIYMGGTRKCETGAIEETFPHARDVGKLRQNPAIAMRLQCVPLLRIHTTTLTDLNEFRYGD